MKYSVSVICNLNGVKELTVTILYFKKQTNLMVTT